MRKGPDFKESVRQSTSGSFGASKAAIKKAVALAALVAVLGIAAAVVPKAKATFRRIARSRTEALTEGLPQEMSPFEAALENLLYSIGD